MKILECDRGGIFDLGFVDCNFVHEDTLKKTQRDRG